MGLITSVGAFGSVQLPCHRLEGAEQPDLTVGEGLVKTSDKDRQQAIRPLFGQKSSDRSPPGGSISSALRSNLRKDQGGCRNILGEVFSLPGSEIRSAKLHKADVLFGGRKR